MKSKLFTFAFLIFTCFVLKTDAQTTGNLSFTFNQPRPTNPAVSGNSNVLAVWIESSTGTFIKTKLKHVSGSTKDHSPTWAVKSGGVASNATGANSNSTDADSGATLKNAAISPSPYNNFGIKTINWDGKNVSGTLNGATVADGTYKIWVESSWSDGPNNIHNEIISFPFTKGTSTSTTNPVGDSYINGITLTWTPTQAGVNDLLIKPEVTIYPNPTNGIFNMDFKNEVKSIRIVDILGKVVYSEKVASKTIEATKSIDLSNLNNGLYIVSITNDNGTSNYKVILNK
jgi:hypothetical protein